MSRHHDCPIVLASETDARFRLLPLGARYLWLALLRLAKANDISVLRFGSKVPNQAQLAAMIATTESEVDAYLPGLIEWGLLVREEDGALAAPFLCAALTRSEINRINGLKGGRPRKGPTAPQREQREMLMPMPASPSTAETEKPTRLSVSQSAIAKAKTLVPSSSLAAIDRDEAKRIGRAAMAEANLSFDGGHAGIVGKWLAAGATEDVILSVIRSKMGRGAQPTHLGYFNKAVLEAASAERSECSSWSVAGQAWARDVDAWQHSGSYTQRGPRPQRSDYADDGSRIRRASA